MTKNTTPKEVKDIINRGVNKLIKEDEIEKTLKESRSLRIKHGIDPSSNQIHLGYGVVYRKLRQLQELGHTVVFLMGDFTARFGDPTGRAQARIMKDAEEVKNLTKTYIEQISKILDPKRLEIRFNSEWYDKLKTEELFSILAKFTTAQMLERDMFQERIKNKQEIFLHELLYPVLQGYDSVMLKSDLTVIGSDQIFNEIVGRDLQRIFNQKPQGIIALEVLPGTDGVRKMSQSYGNTIGINEAPDMQYGKIMSIPDNVITKYFELLTDLPEEEIKIMKEEMANNKLNPKEAKEKLAYNIVAWLWGDEEAKEAKEEFNAVYRDKKLPTRAQEHFVSEEKPLDLPHFISASGATTSISLARRKISENAVYIDGERANQESHPQIDTSKEHIIKIGKTIIKTIPKKDD